MDSKWTPNWIKMKKIFSINLLSNNDLKIHKKLSEKKCFTKFGL